jgi:AcrB/AcrD/AcrF family
MPSLISTLSIWIVFVPVTLLSGSAKYIFTPLALNVVLALVASYLLSRILVPTMMHFLLPKEVPLYQGPEKESPLSRSFIWRFHQRFERDSTGLQIREKLARRGRDPGRLFPETARTSGSSTLVWNFHFHECINAVGYAAMSFCHLTGYRCTRLSRRSTRQ